jgi:hypothetical protein
MNAPCVIAFRFARALPAAERGPVDFRAFRRFARRCAGEAIDAAGCGDSNDSNSTPHATPPMDPPTQRDLRLLTVTAVAAATYRHRSFRERFRHPPSRTSVRAQRGCRPLPPTVRDCVHDRARRFSIRVENPEKRGEKICNPPGLL